MKTFSKVFNISIKDKVHKIEASLNYLKGIFTVNIDGKEIKIKNQHKTLLLLDYEFELENVPCNLTYTFFERTFNLVIDKKYLDTNKKYEPFIIPKYTNILSIINLFIPCLLIGILIGLKLITKSSVIFLTAILICIGFMGNKTYTKLSIFKKHKPVYKF